MPIQYTVVEKGNPADNTAPKKFYGMVKSKGDLKLRELANKIAKISTVSNIDTMAVLEALLQVIPDELMGGNIIRLGDFGSFFTTITTEGVENKNDFSSKNIKNISIKFRPGSLVKNQLTSAKYEKAG